MDDIRFVKVFESTEHVINYCLDMNKLKVNTALNDLLEITLSVFHNSVDGREVARVFRLENLDEVNDKRMLDLPEDSDFS